MDVVFVPTTHWDREWYRPFQEFRAHLVDLVDRVLELTDADDRYRFLLDGQTIVCEDYLEVRPYRQEELERRVRDGRIGVGPWYVQPDSLLPSGESHIRNLREGLRDAERLGTQPQVAYTPDSFGHPGQFPQIFAGFGLTAFAYWRGNGSELDELPAEYRWCSPDGSSVVACNLRAGYFNASGLPDDLDAAVERLKSLVERLAEQSRLDRVLLLNGSDHQMPQRHTQAVTEALAQATGWNVRHGLLEDFTDAIDAGQLPTFDGELVGGRIANLLAGVWSSRTYLKLLDRRTTSALVGWAEPWAALAAGLGGPDERPSLRAAWRLLLRNQAHDSIGGCSQDAVHDEMLGRYADAIGLADQTARRACERISGGGTERRAPWTNSPDVAVFNPSPHTRTDLVRFPLDVFHTLVPHGESDQDVHPLAIQALGPRGFEVDGVPARLVQRDDGDRLRLLPEQHDWDVEFVVEDVPAFGWKRVALHPSEPHPDEEDDGRRIEVGDLTVEVEPEGTFVVQFGDRRFAGLMELEDLGDRGDTYDADLVQGEVKSELVSVQRQRHPSGIASLTVQRVLHVPGLDDARRSRTGDPGTVVVTTTARLVPGTGRVDLDVVVENHADDHRLRACFPTGTATTEFLAATTMDVTRRSTQPPDDTNWRHPAPKTFPHQGWVHANGLTVAAPGLPEGEVSPGGTIAVTLVRSVGWLSRHDLDSRPGPAGPGIPTPGAQCHGRLHARLALLPEPDAHGARDHELGLLAVPAWDEPLWPAGEPMLEISPRTVVLSALEPALDGPGWTIRLLNPTDEPATAQVRFGRAPSEAVSVDLGGRPVADQLIDIDGHTIRVELAAHSFRTVLTS